MEQWVFRANASDSPPDSIYI